MTALTLGTKPVDLEINLVRGTDFVQEIERDDGSDWPTDSELYLEVIFRSSDPVTWRASYDGPVAIFNVSDSDVDAVIAARSSAVKLWYVQGSIEAVWAMGKVKAFR